MNVSLLLYCLKSQKRRGSDSVSCFYCYYLAHSCFHPAKRTLLNIICNCLVIKVILYTSVICLTATHLRVVQQPYMYVTWQYRWCKPVIMLFLYLISPGGGATWPTQTRKAEQNRQLHLLLSQVIYICWVTESEPTFLFVTCHMLRVQPERRFLFFYSAHRPVRLQLPDLRVWLLNIVQVPPVSGQCALWVCAQCRQWFRCKSPK